jgi:hypothetical protein
MDRGKKHCFVIMPFRQELDRVYDRIRLTAAAHGLVCSRGDDVMSAGFVLQVIRDHIERADVVVADLTGRNANVFYETAIAHMLKGLQQVILIAQRDRDVPVDLMALRYLRYRADDMGLAQLATNLGEFMKQALAAAPGEDSECIEGKTERTRRIVAEYNALLREDQSRLATVVIRSRAGLSSLAIDPAESRAAAGEEQAYRKLLVEERSLLMELIRKGATFRAILTPPTAQLWRLTELPARYERLISLLEGASTGAKDALPAGRCQVVLCPLLGNNLLIIGDRVLYEGAKGSLQGGFDLTTRITHAGIVAAQVRAFEALYKDARGYTLNQYGSGSVKGGQKRLQDAVVAGLQESLARYVETEAQSDRAATARRPRPDGGTPGPDG